MMYALQTKPCAMNLLSMHGADAAPFHALRAKMETEWTPQMMEVLGVDRQSLPINLGRRLPVRPPDRIWRRQLRLVRDQRQFALCDPGSGPGCDRPLGVEAIIECAAGVTVHGSLERINERPLLSVFQFER
jgi:hypothetical protein